ncbi:MAG TPA: hypothetical protein O0W81_02500 [Methanocorpusculum sp.]|nr:hypothetical protein [Methanocorpusculum sp.]
MPDIDSNTAARNPIPVKKKGNKPKKIDKNPDKHRYSNGLTVPSKCNIFRKLRLKDNIKKKKQKEDLSQHKECAAHS